MGRSTAMHGTISLLAWQGQITPHGEQSAEHCRSLRRPWKGRHAGSIVHAWVPIFLMLTWPHCQAATGTRCRVGRRCGRCRRTRSEMRVQGAIRRERHARGFNMTRVEQFLTRCILTKGFGPKQDSQTIGMSLRSHPSVSGSRMLRCAILSDLGLKVYADQQFRRVVPGDRPLSSHNFTHSSDLRPFQPATHTHMWPVIRFRTP